MKSDRSTTAQLARVLRTDGDAEVFAVGSVGRTLLETHGSERAVMRWFDYAIASLLPRQAAILRRYDRNKEPVETILRELALTRRHFYRERRRGLMRLAELAGLTRPQVAQLSDPFARAFENADAAELAGQTQRALAAYRQLLQNAGEPDRRVLLLARSITTLARCGQVAEAKRAIALAEGALSDVRGDSRRHGEGELLVAKLRLSRYSHDAASFARAISALQARFGARALAGDDEAIRYVATSFIESAERGFNPANCKAAAADAEQAERLAARSATFPIALRVQAAAVGACARWLVPEQMFTAQRDLIAAYHLAREHKVQQTALQVLDGLASIAWTHRRTAAAIRIAQTLLNQARRDGCEEQFLWRNEILIALAENRLAGGSAGLARLDALRAREIPEKPFDGIDFARAHILVRSGKSDRAGEILSRIVDDASDELYVGLALWERSCLAANEGRVAAAARDIEAALPLLARNLFPIRVATALGYAYTLTGRRRYRDDALDLWQLIEPAVASSSEIDDSLSPDGAELSGESAVPPATADSDLTARQRQIARLVRSGKTNREIASTLQISARTVDQHVASIMQRQNVDRRWQIGGALLVLSS
ncbi:MAG: helix-turn-helix transcriptional regulator [Candidatus Cybelea sp.]